MTGEKWAAECQAPGTKTSDGRAMVDLILYRSGLTVEVSKLNRIFHCLITYAALAAEFGLGTTDTGLPHRRVILHQPCNVYAERVEL